MFFKSFSRWHATVGGRGQKVCVQLPADISCEMSIGQKIAHKKLEFCSDMSYVSCMTGRLTC